MGLFTKLGWVLAFFFASLQYCFVPTVVIDAAAPGAAVSSRASGNLYGLSEAGVPDDLTVDSLDIASVSQKSPAGLQHPTGDLDHVAGALDKADYLVTYLQDDYDSWYYDHRAIEAARADGTWDWQAFLRTDYLPRVEKTARLLAEKPYADRVVCCLYNECDNGLWFGETRTNDDGGVWGEFNEAGRDSFFAAWKETYELVRRVAPGLKIGGPGYYEYNIDKERAFLRFCRENGCLPDVMIYHELGEFSGRYLAANAAEYRALEAELGIPALPVIVTEYGMMSECGEPARMLPYICGIETAGVYGNIAYWRLANNLNDNAADGNMPNACWWLYRWYADLEGSILPQEKRDLFHGDFAKAVREGRPMKYKDFYSLAVLNDGGDGLTVLCGACTHTGQLRFKNLQTTGLGKRARVRVEEVRFRGLTGEVTAPTLLKDYDASVRGGALTVKIKDMREGAVYRVTLAPADGTHDPVGARPAYYEAEDGRLLGNAYTYRSAYAATGGTEERPENLVGGMENPGDGVEIPVRVPAAGDYDLDIIYGKHNDGEGPAGRVTGTALLTVVKRAPDGAQSFSLTLPNTIKSEYTACVRQRVYLSAGKNTIRFEHLDGTFVLDGIQLTRVGYKDQVIYDLRPEEADAAQALSVHRSVRDPACFPDVSWVSGEDSSFRVRRGGVYDLALSYYTTGGDTSVPLTVNGETVLLPLPDSGGKERLRWVYTAVTLKKGKNTLALSPGDGDFRIAQVRLSAGRAYLALLPEAEHSGGGRTACIAVAPADGYYTVFCDTPALKIDGGNAGRAEGSADVYLRRGLNLLELEGENAACRVSALRADGAAPVLPAEMTLTAPAAVDENGVLTGIGSAGGAAAFTFAAPAAGDYRVTLCYANNAEGGYHDYNVDLIEEYFTVAVNGKAREVMCRSTYSDETFSTVTFNVTLPAGESEFILSNDGAIRFAGRETEAPRLKWISVNPARK